MKIKSGYLKGKNIEVPESAKPTKSIVVNSIFSSLEKVVKDSTCVDLFAGSGLLGFEAVSRGAKFCTFVESSYSSSKTIEKTILKLNLEDKCDVYNMDAIKFIGNCEKDYDVVFLDPPYNLSVAHIFKILNYILKPNSMVVYLKSSKTQFMHPNCNIQKERMFGKTEVLYLKFKP